MMGLDFKQTPSYNPAWLNLQDVEGVPMFLRFFILHPDDDVFRWPFFFEKGMRPEYFD